MSGEKISTDPNRETNQESSSWEEFEPFNPERAKMLQAKAKEAAEMEDLAKGKARDKVNEDFNHDADIQQVYDAEETAASLQERIAKEYEQASELETGDPVVVKVKKCNIGEFFVPDTPSLDSFLAGEGTLARPVELMPMMEHRPSKLGVKDEFDFRSIDQFSTGKKIPNRSQLVSLGVRYLAYQEQRQYIRNKKEAKVYDSALRQIETSFKMGMAHLKDEKESDHNRTATLGGSIGESISREFVKLKAGSFYEASSRRRDKFTEDPTGAKELDAAQRFSVSFNSGDLVGDRDAEGSNLSQGGTWQQNKNTLEAYKNNIALLEKQLQEKTGPISTLEKTEEKLERALERHDAS